MKRLSFSYDVLIMNLNASCGNHSMGLFRAFKSLLLRPSQRPLCVVGRVGRGKKRAVDDGKGTARGILSLPIVPRALSVFSIIFIFRVRSIGKSRFWICDRTRNPKTDFNAEKSVFGFPFYRE